MLESVDSKRNPRTDREFHFMDREFSPNDREREQSWEKKRISIVLKMINSEMLPLTNSTEHCGTVPNSAEHWQLCRSGALPLVCELFELVYYRNI